MATVVNAGANQVKLGNGSTVTAQQGGWYDGEQYWGGSLSTPGVINSQSNQQGAGQPVSSATVAQTSPGNVAYLNNLNDVQNHLNTTQNSTYTNYVSGDIPGVQSASEIDASLKDSGLLPTTAAPTAPNLASTYQTLTSQAGVTGLQQDITDLKAQQDAIAGQALVTKQSEEGKFVAQNVMEGRVSQETQQAQDQYDFITRQLTAKTDQLNSALTNIQTIMQFTQQDYSNAETSYNDQFQQAVSTINLVEGIQQGEKTDAQNAIDNARANLQIYVNAITNGNLNPNALQPDQQAQLNKLEVQSGLPVGFVQSLQIDPSKSLIYTGKTANGQIQVLTRGADGTIQTSLYGSADSGSSATVGSAAFTANINTKAVTYLSQNANSYGDVSPAVWQATKTAYIKDGGTAAQFDAEFKQYADTNRGDFANAYGFANPQK